MHSYLYRQQLHRSRASGLAVGGLAVGGLAVGGLAVGRGSKEPEKRGEKLNIPSSNIHLRVLHRVSDMSTIAID